MSVDISGVKKTLQLNHAAFDAVREKLRLGMTGLELYDIVSHAYIREARQAIPFTGDFLIGVECGGISGPPTDCALRYGDTVIADLLPQWNGFFCDTTRVFFLGAPNERQRLAYEAVIAALRAGEELLWPGVRANEIYAAVSGALTGLGFESLPHHAGHGVGFSWYEPPFFTADHSEILEAGMVVALEPGIYFKDAFGIRVENNYWITPKGPVDLLPYPEDIEHFCLNPLSK